jgi:nitrous oxide reductase accessory protein NosL
MAVILGNLSPASAAVKPPPQVIPEQAACGVCGMYPARFLRWQAEIIFTDGRMVPFDGPKDMFKYLFKMAEYDKGHTRADVAAIWVRNYSDGNWLDGEAAFFVIGSSVTGPMGRELVPLANGVIAKEFISKNGGGVSRYSEIDLHVIQKIDMGSMKMGNHRPGGM